jgi:hypothetical protein
MTARKYLLARYTDFISSTGLAKSTDSIRGIESLCEERKAGLDKYSSISILFLREPLGRTMLSWSCLARF